MIDHALECLVLIAITVIIHGVGTLSIMWVLTLVEPSRGARFRIIRSMIGLVQLVVSLIVLHILEVGAWAVFYLMMGILPNFREALYFSIVTYTTVGYGDVVLPEAWRILGGCEALIGILMTAWSTAILIPAVSRLYNEQAGRWALKRQEKTGTEPARRSKR